jgi:hypothetical protein
MATTAVVAGTATAVHGSMTNRQNQKNQAAYDAQAQQQAATESQIQMAQMQAEMDALKAQQAPAPVAAAPAAGGTDLMSEIQKLADMKNAGILSEEEFAAAKAKLLA